MATIKLTPDIRRGRVLLAFTVVLGHAIKHIYNSGLQTILLPEIKIGMGLSATQLGTLAFSRQATGWVMTVGAGYLGDRFANRASLMLAVSMLLMGISYFLAGHAPTYVLMVGAMLLIGIGPSMYHPPAMGALSRRFPDKRGFMISLHGTGGSVGEVFGPLVAAGALAYLVWREVLQISLIPAIFAAFLIWAMMRSVPGAVPGSASTGDYFRAIAGLLRKGKLAILVLVTALRSMGQSAVMIFLPVYLTRRPRVLCRYGCAVSRPRPGRRDSRPARDGLAVRPIRTQDSPGARPDRHGTALSRPCRRRTRTPACTDDPSPRRFPLLASHDHDSRRDGRRRRGRGAVHYRLADLRRQLHRNAVPGLRRSDRRQLRHAHRLRVRRCGRPSRHPNPGPHQAPKHRQPTYAIIASINAMWGFQ